MNDKENVYIEKHLCRTASEKDDKIETRNTSVKKKTLVKMLNDIRHNKKTSNCKKITAKSNCVAHFHLKC